MNILENILREKRLEILERRLTIPLARLKDRPSYGQPGVSLEGALRMAGFGIIAELKKASPSKGLLRSDFDPVEIAQSYERGGASGISVLTDEKFFRGSIAHLEKVRAAVRLPLLRKDFIVDSYQLHEAKAAGADAVLLIVAALDRDHLRDLNGEAMALGLETLIEVHNEAEMERALGLPLTMIGVNNRDLVTFRKSLETSVRLGRMLPPDILAVSESGICTPEDLSCLAKNGYRAALVGETFLRQRDPGEALKNLLGGFRRISS